MTKSQKFTKLALVLAAGVLALSGCGFKRGTGKTSNFGSGALDAVPNYKASNLTQSLNSAAKILVQRLPTTDEYNQAATGVAGYEAVVRQYLESQPFLDAMREYHHNFFEMAGVEGGVNMEEPTNLALYLIKNNLDYRDVARANYCVDNGLTTKSTCSTFAGNAGAVDSNSAGILTTKAFLTKWSSAFNFRRVKKAFSVLSCNEYPDPDDIGQPLSEISGSKKSFNKTAVTDTPACFSCHKSVNPRAAIFYNFTTAGLYSATTTNTTRDDANQMSTLADLLVSGAQPKYHDDSAGGAMATMSNMRDYGALIAKSKGFARCSAQRWANFMLGRDHKEPLQPELEFLIEKMKATNFNVKEVIVEITKSAAFVNR